MASHFGSHYSFGHGHSYTHFDYCDLTLESDSVDIESGDIRMGLTLTNIGNRLGVEIPQLYVRDLLASLVRPIKQLKGFTRVELEAGASARLQFCLRSDMLNFTGSAGVRIVEPVEFHLMIGASSGDIRLQTTVKLIGEVRTLGSQWRMQSTCDVQPIKA